MGGAGMLCSGETDGGGRQTGGGRQSRQLWGSLERPQFSGGLRGGGGVCWTGVGGGVCWFLRGGVGVCGGRVGWVVGWVGGGGGGGGGGEWVRFGGESCWGGGRGGGV